MLSPQTATDERLTAALRDSGHRVTSQRIVLHRVLAELGRHTTAEELAGIAGARLPGLSLPTVYATLELFEDLGLVRRVSAGGSAALYDPRTDEHQHFVCRRCGAVADVEAIVDAGAVAGAARATGLAVEGVEVMLRGVCRECTSRG
jgi:Fur family ferric uptake transcriptional regulator/Fur family peroxide stress response transcriptional regulator